MLNIDGFIEKANGKAKIYRDFRLVANKDLTDRLTICIPDMHLLERGPNDDFLDNNPENERTYYLMDCGSWVNGGHEIGVISGKEIAVCQWG